MEKFGLRYSACFKQDFCLATKDQMLYQPLKKYQDIVHESGQSKRSKKRQVCSLKAIDIIHKKEDQEIMSD